MVLEGKARRMLDQKDLWDQLIQEHKDQVVQQGEQVMMGKRTYRTNRAIR